MRGIKRLQEAKTIGGHAGAKDPWKSHAIVATIDAALRPGRYQALQDVGQRFVFPEFARVEAAFRRELKAVLANVQTANYQKAKARSANSQYQALSAKAKSKVSKPQPAKDVGEFTNRKVKALFRKYYTDAFRLGKKAAKGGVVSGTNKGGFTQEDKRWLETFLRKEFEFWKKFMDAVRAGTTKMDVSKRLEMYVQTLKSMYNTSRAIAAPPTTLFYWETTPAEHCPHCIYLSLKSPFTKANLPTIPASGDTVCKSNCRCHLRVAHVSVAQYMRVKKDAPTREELLRGMRALKG